MYVYVCVYIYIYKCIPTYTSLSLSIYIYIYMYVCIYIYMYICICLFTPPPQTPGALRQPNAVHVHDVPADDAGHLGLHDREASWNTTDILTNKQCINTNTTYTTNTNLPSRAQAGHGQAVRHVPLLHLLHLPRRLRLLEPHHGHRIYVYVHVYKCIYTYIAIYTYIYIYIYISSIQKWCILGLATLNPKYTIFKSLT